MAIEQVKNQMQLQNVQNTSYKPNNVATEVSQMATPVQGSAAGTSESTESEESQRTTIHESRIKSAVNHVNSQMRNTKTRCEFSYHEETNRVSIKVINKETQEVIREIPPEETLEMVERMWELAGILVDERR